MGFKHLFISIHSSIDTLITKMENHEAIAEHVIQEVSESAANLTQENYLLDKQIDTLIKKEASLTEKCNKWAQRAKDSTDKPKALECVAQLKQTQKERDKIREYIAQKEQLLSELNEELTKIDSKLNDLKHKKLLLASRETFTKNGYANTTNNTSNADELFNRWEKSVLKKEWNQGTHNLSHGTKNSSIEREFQKQEDQEELEEMLKQIKENTSN